MGEAKGKGTEEERGLARCLYCGQLPAVWHLHCARCGSVACLDCALTENERDWMCESCVAIVSEESDQEND